MLTERQEALFWAKVDRKGPDECWAWTAGLNPRGYGKAGFKIRERYAHRLAWEMAHGPIPAGMVVRHKCDNPPCVNPDHLQVGTQIENMRDMKIRGRARSSMIGRTGRPKLTPEG